MTDIQLRRNSSGYLPHLTHWEPHEPAIKKSKVGNTDHWSKMKHKVASVSIQDKSGKNRVFHADRMRHEKVHGKASYDNIIRLQHEIDGTLTRIGNLNFSDLIVKELHGKLPGDYYKPRPLPPKLLRTAANARAREGHKYWYMEKTFKNDPGKKNTMGSAKTFLGYGQP